MLITGDTIIGDLLDKAPGLEDILLENGMHCLGCPSARNETLGEACEVHGIDISALLADLNNTVSH